MHSGAVYEGAVMFLGMRMSFHEGKKGIKRRRGEFFFFLGGVDGGEEPSSPTPRLNTPSAAFTDGAIGVVSLIEGLYYFGGERKKKRLKVNPRTFLSASLGNFFSPGKKEEGGKKKKAPLKISGVLYTTPEPCKIPRK